MYNPLGRGTAYKKESMVIENCEYYVPSCLQIPAPDGAPIAFRLPPARSGPLFPAATAVCGGPRGGALADSDSACRSLLRRAMATRKDGGDGGGGLRVHCAGGRPWDYRSALAHLAAAGMSEAVAEHGLADASLERWCASKEPFECSGQSLFSALCRIIVYQQLAGAAASKIYGRFKDLFPGEPTPAMVKARGMEIQGVGLSRRKAEYILDLSEAMLDGRLRADEVGAMSNADLSAMLCSVRGIGQWSCDM